MTREYGHEIFTVVWSGTQERQGACESLVSGGSCALSAKSVELWHPRGRLATDGAFFPYAPTKSGRGAE